MFLAKQNHPHNIWISNGDPSVEDHSGYGDRSLHFWAASWELQKHKQLVFFLGEIKAAAVTMIIRVIILTPVLVLLLLLLPLPLPPSLKSKVCFARWFFSIPFFQTNSLEWTVAPEIESQKGKDCLPTFSVANMWVSGMVVHKCAKCLYYLYTVPWVKWT